MLTSTTNADTSPAAMLHAILAAAPLKTDSALIPPWAALVGKCMLTYARAKEPAGVEAEEVAQAWKTLFPYLEASEAPVRRATAAALGYVVRCLSRETIAEVVREDSKNSKNIVHQIISQLTKSLDALVYVRALPELLGIIASLVSALRCRPGGRGAPTAAETLLAPLFVKVGDMRVQNGFEYKEAADGVLGTAMSVVGPEVLLRVLPLNLMPEDRLAPFNPLFTQR